MMKKSIKTHHLHLYFTQNKCLILLFPSLKSVLISFLSINWSINLETIAVPALFDGERTSHQTPLKILVILKITAY